MKIKYKDVHFRKNSLQLIDIINGILDDYCKQGYELTLRQTYYQLVARDLIPNNERSYKNIGNLVNSGRLAGLIDWDAIVDRTRNLRQNSHWSDPAEIIETAAESFALDKWTGQSEYIEVWVEKDALVDIVGKACEPLDVAYFSCRGYNSQSEMQVAARRIQKYQKYYGKNCHIIHFGDHDPSGTDMSRDIESRLNELFGADVEFRRVGLTMEQVQRYNLPPNPAKVTDTRSQKYISRYGNVSWELDALEPTVLTELIRDNVLEFRDDALYREVCRQEEEQKKDLNLILQNYDKVIHYLRDETAS